LRVQIAQRPIPKTKILVSPRRLQFHLAEFGELLRTFGRRSLRIGANYRACEQYQLKRKA